MKMQRTPAPIFNHRKRPRQAVISNPQTIDGFGSNQSTAAGQCSDLMPVGGFSYTAPQRNFQKKPNRSVSQTESKYSTFNGGNTMPQREIPGSQQQRHNMPLKMENNNNQNMVPVHQQRDGYKLESFRSKGNVMARNQTNYVGETNSYNNNIGNRSFQTGQQSESHKFQQRGLKVEKNQGKINFLASGDYSQNTRSKTLKNSSNMCDQGNYVGCYGDAGQQNYRGVTDNEGGSCIQNQSAVKEKNHSRQGSVKQSVDKSLRFITTTVQGIKHWRNLKDNINMIFEVFGILDSALMRKSGGVGKVFQLRDERDSMQCVFYEIDRILPRLIRGHWHRCVGTYDKEQEIFKCVSIRSTTLEEKKKSSSNIELCEKSLSSLRRSISEQ